MVRLTWCVAALTSTASLIKRVWPRAAYLSLSNR